MCDEQSGSQGRRVIGRRRVLTLMAGAGSLLAAGCAGGGATGLGLNLVSQDQLAGMGQQSWERLLAETRPSDNRTYRQAAEKVSTRLLRAAGLDPSGWEIRVFEGDMANAFALPGQKIGVYEGLFRYAENEAQLAAVIAHEIAHNLEAHAAERLSSQLVTQAGISLAGAALGAGNLGDPQLIAGVLGMGAQYGLILPYSRNQELEADRVGLTIMARAGYDPRAAIELWRNMEQAGSRPPTFLSTHPGPEDRIAALERLMPEALEVYNRSG